MTQFLLAKAAVAPVIRGFRATALELNPSLVNDAKLALRDAADVWVLRPDGGEVDDLLENAAQQMFEGATYRETEVAEVVTLLFARVDAFAFFWAAFPEDLPIAHSEDEAHQIIESDLRETRRAAEAYVRWWRT